MNLLLKDSLLAAGYADDESLEPLLLFALTFAEKGNPDHSYILKRVKKRFGPPPPALPISSSPAPVSEAIRATNAEEASALELTRAKLRELLYSPVIQRAALMPDACIAGTEAASLPVGGIVAADKAIIPSAHSADICCSLLATFYDSNSSAEEEMSTLRTVTRFGPGGRPREDWIDHPILHEAVWQNPFLAGLEEKAAAHLGDQGDGNHFSSLGTIQLSATQEMLLRKSQHDELVDALGTSSHRSLVTHHGSRGLGAALFKRGLAAAKKHTHALNPDIPDAACWLAADSPQGQDYWEALQYVARWTLVNHQIIHERFLSRLGVAPLFSMGNEHNFVWKRGETFLHGKGATPAWPDAHGRPRLGLIPLNMREPILLVLGSDNTDHLSFAPHGAGRNLSRSAYLNSLRKCKSARDPKRMDKLLADATEGIRAEWYSGKADVTETAGAYKDAATIRAQLSEFSLAEVAAEITPRACLMAGQSKSWKELRAEHLSPKQKRQMQHRAERRTQKQRGIDYEY